VDQTETLDPTETTDRGRPGPERGEWHPPRRGRGRGTVPRWVAVALGMLGLPSTVAAVVFGMAWSGAQDQATRTATVTKVATTFLDDLTNFKPTSTDADFTALLSFATGDFAKQANQFFGTAVRQQLEQAQAQSEGQVRSVYVQSFHGNSAEVYAVVDQTYVNATITKSGGQPVPDVLRVVLDLTDVAGTRKVSEVSVLQAPSSPSASGTAPSGG